jgi:peptidoglycan/xylan/chitin deacetylase (PgdA/CDA1 family)
LNPIRELGDRLSQGWQAKSALHGVRAAGAASKPWLRDGLAEVLAKLGATAPARFARGALTIITFHRVIPEDRVHRYPVAGLGVTPEQLELVLTELASYFRCGSVIEGYRSWRSATGSDRPLLGISFDGGALDNYEYARPVLDKLGLHATFYIPVANVREQRAAWHDRLGFALLRSVAAVRQMNGTPYDRLLSPFGLSVNSFAAVLPADAVRLASGGVAAAQRLSSEQRERSIGALEKALGGSQVPDHAGLMSWDQVRALHAAGHEIGSHSFSYWLLPALPDARVKEEVEGSRRELSDLIGAEVASFCYPDGGYDERALQALQSAGYECAVTNRWGLNRKQSPFELARCHMDYARLQSRRGDFSKERLWLRLSGLQPGLVPHGHGQ